VLVNGPEFGSKMEILTSFEDIEKAPVGLPPHAFTHYLKSPKMDLPLELIRARIALGLTQRDLAKRVGLKEQQIQRYENNGYASASYVRLMEIVSALRLNIRKEISLPRNA